MVNSCTIRITLSFFQIDSMSFMNPRNGEKKMDMGQNGNIVFLGSKEDNLRAL